MGTAKLALVSHNNLICDDMVEKRLRRPTTEILTEKQQKIAELLGLTAYETKVYTTLREATTFLRPGEISIKSDVPGSKLYESLYNLQKMGLVKQEERIAPDPGRGRFDMIRDWARKKKELKLTEKQKEAIRDLRKAGFYVRVKERGKERVWHAPKKVWVALPAEKRIDIILTEMDKTKRELKKLKSVI